MYKDYEKLFAHLTLPEPPADLFNQVMRRIQQEQRPRALKWQFAFFVILFLSSAVSAIPTFQWTRSALAESGFAQFMSLLFSDTKVVMTYWDSFGIALLESLPIISTIAFLATIFVLLKSLKYVARDIKMIFVPVINTN